MTKLNYNFNIPIANGELLNVPLKIGEVVFVLGANGVGKSALMQKVYNENISISKTIFAHRQIWFTSSASSIIASEKQQHLDNIRYQDSETKSRYTDHSANHRNSISIFNLIDSENTRARKITSFFDQDDIPGARKESESQSPVQAINEILRLSNTLIQIRLEKNDEILVSKDNSELYGISELSDGERNALLICTDVLTAEPGQLVIIDEPERHLHRSIISPLLSTLFAKRKDCTFIISTHDMQLPIDYSDSSVVLIRSCTWENKFVKYWEADLISEVKEIPDEIKQSILGSKRKILFVEGLSSSLDQQFYQLIYPELSVVNKGSCIDVINAVKGGNGINDLTWIEFYGLIDADDRTAEQIQLFLAEQIATTETYSVESLYYHVHMIKTVATEYSKITGQDANELYKSATSNILKEFEKHKSRMCARLCEKRVHEQVLHQLPNHKNIITRKMFEIKIDLNEIILREESFADELIANEDLNGIISRYPIRETSIIDSIVKGIGTERSTYEGMVRKMISDNSDVKFFYRDLLKQLTKLVVPSIITS